jgi:hypothetical protein
MIVSIVIITGLFVDKLECIKAGDVVVERLRRCASASARRSSSLTVLVLKKEMVTAALIPFIHARASLSSAITMHDRTIARLTTVAVPKMVVHAEWWKLADVMRI